MFLGVFSHLMLDEIYSVEWTGGRWRFKSSFGTALKLWGDSAWGNFSTYSKLAIVVVLILSEPMIMERYGQLSPIVVNNEALRERLRLPPGRRRCAGGRQWPATASRGRRSVRGTRARPPAIPRRRRADSPIARSTTRPAASGSGSGTRTEFRRSASQEQSQSSSPTPDS